MTVHPVQHIGVAIARPFADVYAFLADPANFAVWASGLGRGFSQIDGLEWQADAPDGPVRVRFSARNDFGILDHTVIPANGAPMLNPMRVFANGDGSEVVFSLIRRPGMSDADLARDADWVARDLQAMKAHLEG